MADFKDCPLLPFAHEDGRCDRCGAPLTGRQTRWCRRRCQQLWAEEHHWPTARRRAKARDRHVCRNCGGSQHLEVNHIVPREGKGYRFGCWNHLDGLETLCRSCHQDVTKEQMRLRREAKE